MRCRVRIQVLVDAWPLLSDLAKRASAAKAQQSNNGPTNAVRLQRVDACAALCIDSSCVYTDTARTGIL
jgi:hypothetical protein